MIDTTIPMMLITLMMAMFYAIYYILLLIVRAKLRQNDMNTNTFCNIKLPTCIIVARFVFFRR